MRGIEFVPITFEVAGDLASWRVEVPGRVVGRAEALTGPTTPPGKRVQTINPPGSEVGPGQIATWGRSVEVRTQGFGLDWTGESRSSKHIPFDWTGPDAGVAPGRALPDFDRRAIAWSRWLRPSLRHVPVSLLVSLVVLTGAAWSLTIYQATSMDMPMGIAVRGGMAATAWRAWRWAAWRADGRSRARPSSWRSGP